MSLDDLVAHAKRRIQRQWPSALILEQSRTLAVKAAVGGAPETPGKDFRVLVAQDVERGVQAASLVVEKLGSLGEHQVLAQQPKLFLEPTSGYEIIASSVFDPHRQSVSSAIIATSPVLQVFTDSATLSIEELKLAFLGSGLHPVLRDDAYGRAHDEDRPPDECRCHDPSDKETRARPLAAALGKRLVKVWYDEQSLRLGDSLIEGIERGLSRCRYALLVLSPAFLANKRWTAREFRSLVTRDIAEERRIIVPVWLGVTRAEVAAYSLDLADRVAVVIREGMSPEALADQLIAALRLDVPDLRPPTGSESR